MVFVLHTVSMVVIWASFVSCQTASFILYIKMFQRQQIIFVLAYHLLTHSYCTVVFYSSLCDTELEVQMEFKF